MSKKTWMIFIAICVGFLGFLVWQSNSDKITIGNVDTAKIQPANEQNGQIADHVSGNKEAKIVLVEYGDFQCPGCGEIEPTVAAVREKYKDKVAFVYRNFPISQIHPNAMAAAYAVEAAGLQDKYWQMHNLVYSSQDQWENLNGSERSNKFKQFAEQLGLNTDKFVKDTSSDKIAQKIKFDRAVASQDDISATPTFTINGKKMANDDWSSVENASKKIDEALK